MQNFSLGAFSWLSHLTRFCWLLIEGVLQVWREETQHVTGSVLNINIQRCSMMKDILLALIIPTYMVPESSFDHAVAQTVSLKSCNV